MTDTIRTMPVGMLVGASRWPMHHAHPDCWGKPWQGVLLAYNDPRAWQGTLAFGFNPGMPSQDEVDKHVEWILVNMPGYIGKSLPVLWDFAGKKTIHFESAENVRPYSEDLAEWQAERDRARGFKIRLANVG